MTKPPRVWKQIAAVFVVTLVGYVVVFNWIEHRRVKNGPWEVTFHNSNGQLALIIRQEKLAIRDVSIQFPGATLSTNLSQKMRFTPGQKVPFEVPFGRCVFLDPLFLPGKAVLEIAGPGLHSTFQLHLQPVR